VENYFKLKVNWNLELRRPIFVPLLFLTFFSVQRLHGFRQVETHIHSRQTVEIVIYMQDCQLVESHKSASSGPVRSLEAVPARKQTRKQTKNNKQKQAKNTQPQQKQNKNDTEKWD